MRLAIRAIIFASLVYLDVTVANIAGTAPAPMQGTAKSPSANSLYSKSSHLFSPDSGLSSWSPWSVWSPCSRPCGGGITVQTRVCRPAKGGFNRKNQSVRVTPVSSKPQCFGVHKRIHVCNTQKCSYKVKDPRQSQCEEFNGKKFMDRSYIWEPFLGAPNDCAVNCRAIGHMFYATLSPAVQDGVPCRPANASFDGVCIAGKCQQVGCDGVVGSEKYPDVCGVCGGDSSSCRLVSGLFTRPLLPAGYNLVAQLPRGACNLSVTEMKHTSNFLALRYRNGSYILNGDWAINWSGDYEGAGTRFTYRRGSNSVGQHLSSPGPLMEPLDLMLVFQQANPGIKYEYQLSMEAPSESFLPPSSPVHPGDHNVQMMLGSEEVSRHGSKHLLNNFDSYPSDEASSSNRPKTKTKKRKFIWKHSGYSECTRPCAGGLQNPVFTCVREVNLQPVLDKRCFPQEKPALRTIRCNTKPCTAQWALGEWSECSEVCGPGFQTRTIVCQQEITPTLIITVSNSVCTGPGGDTAIATRQPCYRPCEPNVTAYWSMSDWGPCSSSCGPGYKSRTVKCSGPQEVDCVPHEKPPSQVPCDSGPCQSYSWLATEWSEKCSEECGTGLETRLVHCTAGPDQEHLCNVQARPLSLRPCSSDHECGGKWLTGPWSQCSESCGHGKQSRLTVCMQRIRGDNVIVSDTHCSAADRPVSQQSCIVSQCPRWYAGEWSNCSMPCDSGVQKREVQCLDGEEQPSQSCPEAVKPISRRACNTQSCSSQSDLTVEHNLGDQAPTQIDLHPNTLYSPDCTDQFKNCQLVVQARLCKFKYYHQSCCQACTSRDMSSPVVEA